MACASKTTIDRLVEMELSGLTSANNHLDSRDAFDLRGWNKRNSSPSSVSNGDGASISYKFVHYL